MKTRRILICCPDDLARDALRYLLLGLDPWLLIHEVSSPTAALAADPGQYDLVLLDPGASGEQESASVTRHLCARGGSVLVLSGAEPDAAVSACLRVGASGVLTKTLPRQQLVAALAAALKGLGPAAVLALEQGSKFASLPPTFSAV